MSIMFWIAAFALAFVAFALLRPRSACGTNCQHGCAVCHRIEEEARHE
jgi:hypothetical protein